MNLLGIASGQIQAVNPNISVTLKQSSGNTQKLGGNRTPNYVQTTVNCQKQPLSGKDLRQIDGLNLNGTLSAFYFYGDVEATVRNSIKGGDLIVTPDNNTWLVNQVLETWPDWCKVVATLQNGS